MAAEILAKAFLVKKMGNELKVRVEGGEFPTDFLGLSEVLDGTEIQMVDEQK